eukprot:3202547-Prorocentrum_lima.AAC.1
MHYALGAAWIRDMIVTEGVEVAISTWKEHCGIWLDKSIANDQAERVTRNVDAARNRAARTDQCESSK